jgi:hypothetical protein
MEKSSNSWPSLPFADWKDTLATLHLWTQIAGKFRLVQSPWINHSWHATFYLTARGLTSSPIPYKTIFFQFDFDFQNHTLQIQNSNGVNRTLELRPRTVADFYREVVQTLKAMEIDVKIHTTPNEMVVAIPFEQDETHSSYDPDFANRWWTILLNTDRVFKEFRSRYLGKSSPVHFFWGSFDLAVTRFSGRKAPEHPGNVPHLPDWVAKEAYSHEVSSAGFWPGADQVPFPLFYSYAYPEPGGFGDATVRPADAYYHRDLREFVLPYDALRSSANPDQALLDFLQSTYAAAADLAKWDRQELEKNSPSTAEQY